jgi:hypothetical protein
MRACSKCSKEFEPSSRHRKCPTCRGQERPRHKCLNCDRIIRYDYKRCLKCAQFGCNNGNWRGGKTIDHKGYVFVRKIDHPRAKHNNGYVFEHILVMETMLGRYLIKGENIHHINGIKSDNDPENLELWTSFHPPGLRVSDLIDWSKEILKKYDPDSLK